MIEDFSPNSCGVKYPERQKSWQSEEENIYPFALEHSLSAYAQPVMMVRTPKYTFPLHHSLPSTQMQPPKW